MEYSKSEVEVLKSKELPLAGDDFKGLDGLRYQTIKIINTDLEQIQNEIQKGLTHARTLELEFVKRPKPEEFKQLLLFIKKNYSPEQVFLSEKDAMIAGVLFKINMSRPRRAVIEIANGCNLKCDFCWSHSPLLEVKPDANWLKKTLDSKIIYQYLDDLASFGTMRLVEFCAIGDPLYHPDIWNLIEYAKSKGFQLRLSTNGTLLYPDKWDQYCQNPVDELFMNISAGNREVYADIHNVSPKIFDQLMLNLRHINQVRRISGQNFLMRWINIITDKNIANIRQIIDQGIELGANYLDFRYIWIHKNFQKNVGITSEVLNKNLKSLEQTMYLCEALKVENNYASFFKAIVG